jgi:hypothetical protein
MDKQKIALEIVQHMAQQKTAAITPNDGCMYRTQDGKKCAIGGIIPDDLYSEEMEGKLIRGILVGFTELAQYFKNKYGIDKEQEEHILLLNEFQSIHDTNKILTSWPKNFAKVIRNEIDEETASKALEIFAAEGWDIEEAE